MLPGPNGFPAFRAQSDWGWQSAATYGPLHTTPDGPASLLSGPIIHEAQRESSFHGAVYSPPVGNAFDSKFGGLSPYRGKQKFYTPGSVHTTGSKQRDKYARGVDVSPWSPPDWNVPTYERPAPQFDVPTVPQFEGKYAQPNGRRVALRGGSWPTDFTYSYAS